MCYIIDANIHKNVAQNDKKIDILQQKHSTKF